MQIIDLLTPERVQVGAVARSKKRLLELIADLLSENELDVSGRAIYASLCARERLGSTGLGGGVAIPHGRIESSEAIGAFVRLRDALDFDAPDGAPIDLVFAMVVPDHDPDSHLELLGQLAELFSDDNRREQLRQAQCNQDIFDILGQWQSERADA